MHASARNLIITKKPRTTPILDKSIDFPPLHNLHLELLEVKKKLRHGVPLNPVQKRVLPKQRQTMEKEPSEKKETKEKETKEKVPENLKSRNVAPKKEGKKDTTEKVKKSKKVEQEDDDLIAELGEEDIHDELGDDGEEVFEDKEEVFEDEEEVFEDEEIVEEEEDEYAGLTPEEREAKEREEYIWRFRILKKQYKNPQISIPDYNEHSDVPEMKRSYDRTIRELYLDDAVESYKTYLLGGFIVMEFACISWLGLDFSGFTLQQTKMMHKYDRLLIELGEKSYNRWGMNIPVELRLVGLIILQAGIFYLGKIISTKFGNSIGDLFKGITNQPPDKSSRSDESSEEDRPRKSKTMRGPKIKPDDIRNMSHARKKNID